MRIIELVLDEEQEESGVDAISIVESPAIEEDIVALKKQELKLAEVSKDKKLLMGALLVPNKPIYRKSGEDEYYIYFSKDTISKASQLYFDNVKINLPITSSREPRTILKPSDSPYTAKGSSAFSSLVANTIIGLEADILIRSTTWANIGLFINGASIFPGYRLEVILL